MLTHSFTQAAAEFMLLINSHEQPAARFLSEHAQQPTTSGRATPTTSAAAAQMSKREGSETYTSPSKLQGAVQCLASLGKRFHVGLVGLAVL